MGQEVTMSLIVSASTPYLFAAGRLARLAVELDDPQAVAAETDAQRREREDKLLETALSAVLLSFLAVEAVINELYLESRFVRPGHWFPGIDAKVAASLYAAWDDDERIGPIEKAKRALEIANVKTFSFGQGSGQQLCALRDLRNMLTHHEPVVLRHGRKASESDDELERQMFTKFGTAKIWAARGAPFRLRGCLGGSCAQWAHETATLFMADYFRALGCGYPKPG